MIECGVPRDLAGALMHGSNGVGALLRARDASAAWDILDAFEVRVREQIGNADDGLTEVRAEVV